MKGRPPKIAEIFLKIFSESKNSYSVLGDYEEEFHDRAEEFGKTNARYWYWKQVLGSSIPFILNKFFWGAVMIKNYISVAIRVFKKQKIYSTINLLGLATGIACCLLIYLYVSHELSFDTYHKDADRIYRIVQDVRNKESNRIFTNVSPQVSLELNENYPEIEKVGRVRRTSQRLVKANDKQFYEKGFYYIDPEILDIFTFDFIDGLPENCLEKPNSMILTKSIAEKYFGKENPVGKTLNINNRDFLVTALIEDAPTNTHFQYKFLASFKTIENQGWIKNWFCTMVKTYVKLKKNIKFENFNEKINNLADPYVKEELTAFGQQYFYFLFPVDEINLNKEYFGNRGLANLYIYSIVGIVILTIAIFNFINLFTARSTLRAREVGLRKVVGADRKQIIYQFLSEALLLTSLSVIMGIFLSIISLNYFNGLVGSSFIIFDLFSMEIIWGAILLFLIVSLSVGIYPMLVFSKFNPVIVLKTEKAFANSRSLLRNVLIVCQFSLTIFLIIATLVAQEQINFMRSADLGFSKDLKIILPAGRGIDLEEKYEIVKIEFLKINNVEGVTASSSVPGYGEFTFNIFLVGKEDIKNQDMNHIHVDDSFIDVYGIKMLEGRTFSSELKTDVENAAMINRAALKSFGWQTPDEAIGQIVQTGFDYSNLTIIGVTENFHYEGLQNEILPLVFDFAPRIFSYLTLSVSSDNLQQTVIAIRDKWEQLCPNIPFDYQFLDEEFDTLYRSEENTTRLLEILTMLGVLVASLGLLGFITFFAERKTKEIGIRKVMGASVIQIQKILVKDIVKWIAVANLLTWPVAFFIINEGMKEFAYRTEINLFPFIVSGALVLLIVLFAISYQVIKATAANPVESLKHE